jgi:hypothetical protein
LRIRCWFTRVRCCRWLVVSFFFFFLQIMGPLCFDIEMNFIEIFMPIFLWCLLLYLVAYGSSY